MAGNVFCAERACEFTAHPQPDAKRDHGEKGAEEHEFANRHVFAREFDQCCHCEEGKGRHDLERDTEQRVQSENPLGGGLLEG